MNTQEIDKKLEELSEGADTALYDIFKKIDKTSEILTKKVLDAFREERISASHFDSTTGYGYDDKGRDSLDRIYAKVFGKEAAFVRHNLVSGTHALTVALFGILRPGDVMLSVTGKPYDTLDEVIGLSGNPGDGSLKDFGVIYRETALGADFTPELADKAVKMVYIQRSKGYLDRPTLSVADINEITAKVHAIRPDVFVVVDNCYGEFTEENEPDADLLVGSLIKNPGGGIAESGGYVAGSAKAVELVSYRFTCPGIGLECGATLGQNRNMYKGLFFAPHIVAQALKTAHFAAYVFEKLGFDVYPSWQEKRYDIIQTVRMGEAEKLCAFCRGIQAGSPVDSFARPEPWAMPGYSDEVIMAAGTFTQGASLELSADGPIRAPYIVFMQGGLTYESGKIGILSAAREVLGE